MTDTLTVYNSDPSVQCLQILTPEQTARCLVRSYPWYPDSLTMCTYVAADMGDANAMALIHRIPASPTSSLQQAQSGSLDSSDNDKGWHQQHS